MLILSGIVTRESHIEKDRWSLSLKTRPPAFVVVLAIDRTSLTRGATAAWQCLLTFRQKGHCVN